MKKIITILALLLPALVTQAQHEHHGSQKDTVAGMKTMTGSNMQKHGAQQMQETSMSHAFSLNLPMNRNGSGTGWLPDNAPMYGKMFHGKKWMYMLHGNIFLRYNSQDIFHAGSRGASKYDAPNWLMFMGQTRTGKKGLFHFSAMLSLDAAIAGGSGYPLLFQSGETWQGQPLVDRQHPHDLFSELSVSYTHSFNSKTDAYFYLGYPGEPALGSVAFMHRPSALTNPDAPISHHWNDGTHITFGVATAGIRYGKFKAELSSFTGREPNENRWNFDRPLFDSRSGRISFAPNRHWVMQLSQAWIKSPEPLHTAEDVNRSTASVIYSYSTSKNRLFNATALWGRNKTAGQEGEHAFLLEGSYALNRLNLYTRYEWVQKSAEELNLDEAVYGHHSLFGVHAFTLGSQYDILQLKSIRLAAGLQGSVYAADAALDQLYGKNPVSGQVYLRLYPQFMRAM